MINFDKLMAVVAAKAKVESGDRKTQVGAAAVLKGRFHYGVNHLFREVPEEDIVARTPFFYDSMTHAECDMVNKLEAEGKAESLRGATVVVTLYPCDKCAQRLIDAGVAKIITKGFRPSAAYHQHAKQLLAEAGVEVEVTDDSLSA